VPNTKLCYSFPDYHSSVFCDECINFLVVRSIVVVLGRLPTGRLAMSMLPTLKCFTQHCTLLHPWRNLDYIWWSWSKMFTAEMFSSTRNSVTACWWNVMLFTAPLSQGIMSIGCTCAGPTFQIAENSYGYRPYNP
jgi:hypothetical protein